MREKLIELLDVALFSINWDWGDIPNTGELADHLLANGVTFATDTNVGGKWIPVGERLPEPFVSVLVNIPGEKPFPTVREGFLEPNGMWYAKMFRYNKDEVTHWMPLPEPPKEGE